MANWIAAIAGAVAVVAAFLAAFYARMQARSTAAQAAEARRANELQLKLAREAMDEARAQAELAAKANDAAQQTADLMQQLLQQLKSAEERSAAARKRAAGRQEESDLVQNAYAAQLAFVRLLEARQDREKSPANEDAMRAEQLAGFGLSLALRRLAESSEDRHREHFIETFTPTIYASIMMLGYTDSVTGAQAIGIRESMIDFFGQALMRFLRTAR